MKETLTKKIADFWSKYEFKIVLILGFILVAVISFEAGFLRGKAIKDKPIVIEKTSSENQTCQQNTSGENSNNSELALQNSQNNKKTCLFVASKNSKKYHVPNCTWAKRIKAENLICFASRDEASQKGYQPDASCIK